MTREQVSQSPAPFNITRLERGDARIAYCNTCRRVIYKGNGIRRISRRVMEAQIETHMASFEKEHSVDIIPTGL